MVKFNFSTTRPTSRTPSTIVLPHLLLKLIEDELDYNVVLHLQQFRRPLGDPGLQNIQLDLSEKISNSNISLVETWTLSSSASSSPKLQFMEKCGGNVSGQHEYFLAVERGYLLHVNFLSQAFFKPHGVHKLLLLVRKSVVLVG